jgi:amino acid adenylation domain-containing protein
MGVMFEELGVLYEAFRAGEGSPLVELGVQYADYAVWQREYLQGEVLAEELKYWRRQLAGAPAVLEMPTDRPRPAVQSYRGASESFRLSEELTEQVKELSRREGVTLFMTLLAAFQVLLSRYSGQQEVVVGSPVAGRQRAETEDLIGFFVNTLALRTDLSGGPTFREVLGRVRETCLEAYAHQELPFERLVEELRPERSLSHQPLFQVMFQTQSSMGEVAGLSGLQLQRLKCGNETAKFDLLLTMVETGKQLSGELNYSTDLFEPETVQRLVGSFQELLQGLTADPEQEIAELPLLTAADRQRLLHEWNETSTDDPPDSCIHQYFEAQAARTPEAMAVIFGAEQLSYQELNERANQLAHQLREQGAGPESLVGVLLERSPAMVVSLLAVLKAGAAYLPLDPAYPAERLAFMLKNSGAQILITQDELRARASQTSAKLVLVDGAHPFITCYAKDNPTTSVAADNLAYVIYTSGSTGQPKGVAITHRSAGVLLEWATRAFSLDELQRTFFATSICFDLSVFELFAPLSCGGTVLLAENVLTAACLAEMPSPTLINAVPSAMAELVRLGGVPRGVRVVNLAGEPLSRQLLESLSALPHVERVWNLYGPTEDTTYSTGTVVTADSRLTPSIGASLSGRRAYVLDERMALVPVGVAGELYLGGDGLSRGYLGHPSLTAERFVPDPYSAEPGARLYRTQDITRWRNTGELEYLGRRDHQVKVRGYRIELQEVEATLARWHGVREAAVAVSEAADGNKELVAYVVLNDPKTGIDELRAWLREQLPEFMVPAWFEKLDHLPLTPNGKIDRRALPQPNHSEMQRKAYARPRTELERDLVNIWAELLKVDRIGINDNFFELGGHSLLAARMTGRVRDTYVVELPLRTIFEAPTIALLAQRIDKLQTTGSEAILTRIPARPRGGGDFGQLLAELDRLSEEDVRARLARGA